MRLPSPLALSLALLVPARALADAPAVPQPSAIEELPPVPSAPKRSVGSLEDVRRLLEGGDKAGSIDLQTAKQEVERQKGNERAALALILPTITGTVTGTHHLITRDVRTTDPNCTSQNPLECIVTATAPATPLISGVLSARVPLVNVRNWYGWGTAQVAVQAAELRVEDKRRSSLALVADAIAGVVAGEKTAELNRVALKAALERAAYVKKRLDLSAAKPIDYVRIQQDVLAARQALLTGDESLRKAREALGQALGLSEAVGVGAGVTLEGLEQAIKAACKPASVEDRPDIRAAKKDLEVSARGVTDVHLSFLPTLDFVTTLAFQNATIFNANPNTWTLQGVLTVPIWDGGARYGQMRSAAAVKEQARLRLRAAELAADVETRQADRAKGVADAAKAIAGEVKGLAEQERKLAEKAFELGEGSSLDVVDATRRERSAVIDVTVKDLEAVRARIASHLASATCR